jgi:hypothetical protein
VAFRVTQPARRAQRKHSTQRVFDISRDLQRNSGGIFLEPMAMASAGDRNDIGRPVQNPSEVNCAGVQFSAAARLAKDFENLAETLATATLASIQLALRRGVSRHLSKRQSWRGSGAQGRATALGSEKAAFAKTIANRQDAPENEPARAGGEYASWPVRFSLG